MDDVEIFIDESGDLGFSSKSSRNFVVAYIIPERPNVLRKKLNKTRKLSPKKAIINQNLNLRMIVKG